VYVEVSTAERLQMIFFTVIISCLLCPALLISAFLFKFKSCCGHGALNDLYRYIDMLLTVPEFLLYHHGISSRGIPYKPEEKLSLFGLAK